MTNGMRFGSTAVAFTAVVGVLATSACRDLGSNPPPAGGPEATIVEKVENLVGQMTLDEKIGQMTQVDRGSLEKESDIRDYYLGSILSGGGSSPSNNSAAGWADMYDRFQSIALQTRLKIPLLYGIDAVHGHNNVYGAVIFPHNIGLGCARNTRLIEDVARVTGEEVAGTGIDWTFSPCIAVPRNERWGRTYEGFGETPELVSSMAAAAVRGYQKNILACAKHFLADGGTAGGEDQGDAQIDEQMLRALHLPGYRAAVREGVGSIMVSFSSWNGQKMHGNRYLLSTVLKGELGFQGFLVSDWGGIDQLPGDYAQKVEASINAGIDMVMVPSRYKDFIPTLRTLVNQQRVTMARIDDAVRRILMKKFEIGLFDRPYTDRSLTPRVGAADHRVLARDAVRQSLVLLKNENKALPLSKGLRRIHVSGRNMDDLGNQCGGWTITWQGKSGMITTGTTIFQAIRNTVAAGTTLTTSHDGSGAEGADAAIVVIGETPYAERQGDRIDLSLNTEDVATVAKVKATGIPTVVVLISGRPMILGQVLDISDACVAAWLPGSEGQGVADVLFGDYPPTGKLSHSWPRMMAQIPVNQGDPSYNPLFPYGYGLSY